MCQALFQALGVQQWTVQTLCCEHPLGFPPWAVLAGLLPGVLGWGWGQKLFPCGGLGSARLTP